MGIDSKSPPWEAQSNYAPKEPLLHQNASTHATQEAPEGERNGVTIKSVWRRKGEVQITPSNSCSSGPLAQEGETFPPHPVARSTDSNLKHIFPTNIPTTQEKEHSGDGDRLVARLSDTLLATLRAHCEKKASISLIGKIYGKHPGLKALKAWARETLHPSLTLLSVNANNAFEVTFDKAEGRIHALKLSDLVCEKASIYFSSWRPHFDPKNPQASDKLDHAIWVQIVDLCQVLREETSFLQEIGEQLGQVISIDNSEAYKSKLYGPRIRILVKDLKALPKTVVIPRLDGEGTMEYAFEFSGLPNQCGRCRSREHQVRHCPKKELHHKKTELNRGDKTTQRQEQQAHTRTEDVILNTQQLPAAIHPPRDLEEMIVSTPPDLLIPIAPLETEPRQSSVPVVAADYSVTDDIHFPKLSTPSKTAKEAAAPSPAGSAKEAAFHSPTGSAEPLEQPHLIWRSKPATQEEQLLKKENEKGKSSQVKIPESTPITRQGYRTGRLAEDFWLALKTPNTPISTRKTLQVIPLLIKDREPLEYLVSSKRQQYQPLAQVHIAELLAGIPWAEQSAQQHVVSEVAQALHKIFVFTSKIINPLQEWKQGQWFATWEEDASEEHVCTLYVTISVKENMLKPRKGHTVNWRRVPQDMWERIQSLQSDAIVEADSDRLQWQQMAFAPTPNSKDARPSATTSPNRFSVLSEEDNLTSSSQ